MRGHSNLRQVLLSPGGLSQDHTLRRICVHYRAEAYPEDKPWQEDTLLYNLATLRRHRTLGEVHSTIRQGRVEADPSQQ